jgi:hypothetical protein
MEPEFIITQAQPSGYMDTLAGGGLRVKLGPIDKVIYVNRMDLRTQVNMNQASSNQLPSATITADFLSTATYNFRNRQEYNEFDVAEAGAYNVALPAAYRHASRQGIFQGLRNAGLFGVTPANGEGLLNTPGATTANLPPDSYGNTLLPVYDAGQLAIWFLGQIVSAEARMYLLGTPTRIILLGPQRVIGQMQKQNIIQTTSYQRPGSGTATTGQVITKIGAEFDDEIEWAYDDTLIGQGAGSTAQNPVDAVLLIIPEIKVATMPGINTNEFAMLQPNIAGNTFQYADVVAPVEVTTPIPEGVDVTSTLRASSGWGLRAQGVTILNIPY